jgi:hypothetical protein
MTRDQIIQKLLDERVIKESEARDLRTTLPPDTPEDGVIAVIKGVYPDLKPRDVAAALGMSVADYGAIKESSFSDFQSMRDQQKKADNAQRILANQEGFNFHFGGSDYQSPDELSKLEWSDTDFGDGREALSFIRSQYDDLKSQGVFSPTDQGTIERRINQLSSERPTTGQIADLIQKMRVGGATEEDLGSVQNALPRQFDFAMTDKTEADWIEENQPQYGGVRSLDPMQQAAAVAGASGVVDSSTIDPGERSFLSHLQADGILAENQTVETRDRLSYTGSGTVLDRATGQVLSESEWELIKTNEKAAEIYRQRAGVSDVVQSLLDSGKFTGTTKKGSQYQTRTVSYYNPETSQYEQRTVTTPQWQNQMPLSDIAFPSAAPKGLEWEAPTYDYKTGDGRAEWLQMSPRARATRIKLMADNGLITPDQVEIMQGPNGAGGNPLNFLAMDIWEQAVSVSSEFQRSPLDAIQAFGVEKAATEAAQKRASGGRVAPTYSVPASLREIPDYKTLAQNTKQIFRGEIGRDMEDWELKIYADELKRQNEVAQERRIGIHKQAWDEAIAGGDTNVDFTAVEDPNTALQYDIEQAYAGEIDRNQRVEDRANTNRLLMNSITTGQRMI